MMLKSEANQPMQRIQASAPDLAYETSLAGPSSLI